MLFYRIFAGLLRFRLRVLCGFLAFFSGFLKVFEEFLWTSLDDTRFSLDDCIFTRCLLHAFEFYFALNTLQLQCRFDEYNRLIKEVSVPISPNLSTNKALFLFVIC
jgi:hypothetical protein